MPNFSFSKISRMASSDDFKKALKNGKKISTVGFKVFCTSNHAGLPRLGMIVPKKNISGAVNRNYIKRVIRETFRINQSHLNNIDVVVLVKHIVGQSQKKQIFQEVDQLWEKLKIALHPA